MPITTQVKNSDVGGGTTVTGEMQDVPGPGGFKSYNAEVVFIADAHLVKFKSATPMPFAKNVNGTSIELRWRVTYTKAKEKKVFDVELNCKRRAKGATCYAWTITSDAKSPKKWNASIGTYYHDHTHCCP